MKDENEKPYIFNLPTLDRIILELTRSEKKPKIERYNPRFKNGVNYRKIKVNP